MATPSKPKTGDVVAIEFLDHVEDGKKPINFTVYGRLIKESFNAYTVACWTYTKPKKTDDNEKVFTIVKVAITNLKKLK